MCLWSESVLQNSRQSFAVLHAAGQPDRNGNHLFQPNTACIEPDVFYCQIKTSYGLSLFAVHMLAMWKLGFTTD